MPKNQNVSLSVIKRLPRYYRFLGELLRGGVTRISSKELAEIMNLTASQIRQDLNCFGGFGQQGYGYPVQALHGEIAKILGLEHHFPIIQIGAGNLGKAVATHMEFAQMGFVLGALFDSSPAVVGKTVGEHVVRHTDEIEGYCATQTPAAAILCIPKEAAKELVPQLTQWGIKAFWNFSHYDISPQDSSIVVENVHLGDSLMTLCYQLRDLTAEQE